VLAQSIGDEFRKDMISRPASRKTEFILLYYLASGCDEADHRLILSAKSHFRTTKERLEETMVARLLCSTSRFHELSASVPSKARFFPLSCSLARSEIRRFRVSSVIIRLLMI